MRTLIALTTLGLVVLLLPMVLVACSTPVAPVTPVAPALVAEPRAVSVTGEEGAYSFAVTLRSPDTGCERYADWWEVLSEDGALLYRRILNHSHPDEQPFTRDGGPVPVRADQTVWVRAHLHPLGYGGAALKGSVSAGFSAGTPPESFASGVETASPQPQGCLF